MALAKYFHRKMESYSRNLPKKLSVGRRTTQPRGANALARTLPRRSPVFVTSDSRLKSLLPSWAGAGFGLFHPAPPGGCLHKRGRVGARARRGQGLVMAPKVGATRWSLTPRALLAVVTVLAEQDLLERLPEHLVEDRVEDGVDHGRGVAQPRGAVEDGRADALLALDAAQRGHQVQHEEGRPQDDEREEDDAQHLGGLLLQLNDAAVARGRARHDGRVARVVTAHAARAARCAVARQAGRAAGAAVVPAGRDAEPTVRQ